MDPVTSLGWVKNILLFDVSLKSSASSYFSYCLFAMSVCAFNYFPNREYSNLFNLAAFPMKSLPGKTCFSVKKSF